MDHKTTGLVEVKAGDKGQISAVFATFNTIDSDGDVTVPGAFTDGAEVMISDWQHTVWQGARPVGKGRIRTTPTEAIFDGQFFMDVPLARDLFLTLKHMGPRQQWSYGYDVLESEPGDFDGRRVRFLKRQLVHEVSPVAVGAGVGTRTLSTKAHQEAGTPVSTSEYRAAIRPHESPITTKAWDGPRELAALDDAITVSDLRSVFAWVDPNADPEVKSSYRFAHHHGPGGEANLRACVAGIAVLNGAHGAKSIPDADRLGVYNHLAAHLVEGDREAPELRASPDGELKFHEEAAAVLAGVSGLLDRAQEVMALRAAKGKALASASVDLLEWVYDDLRRLKSLIDSPQDDLAREYVRFVQSLQPTGE